MNAIGVAMAVFVSAAPLSDEGFKEQMSEAIHRHDSGDYAGAIKIYRSILKDRPHDPTVVYELSLSMMVGKSPSDEQIAFIESELKSKTKQMPQLYASLAAAYDTQKNYAKGEATLKKGLALDAKNVDLQFNLGVNLMMQDKPKQAEAPLRTAALLVPKWPAPWRTLAIALEDNGNQMDAFLVRAHFVLMEPNTPRGKQAATQLWPLLMKGVGPDSGGKITVNVGKGADQLGLKLVAATRYAGHEKESDGEFFAGALESIVGLASELESDDLRKLAVEPFAEAKKAGVLTPLAWMLRRAAGDPDADTWFATHKKEEAQLEAFFR